MSTTLRLGWFALARATRGWRWRVLVLAAVFLAYWLGQRPGFGPGSMVWMPGGVVGCRLLAVLAAVGGGIFGAEALAQWQRHESGRLLAQRLVNPVCFTVGNVGAAAMAVVLPLMLVSYWSALGAWRHGLLVYWAPNALFGLAVLLPLGVVGAAAGFLGRAILNSDGGGLALGGLLMAPAVAFRGWFAPPEEFFLHASVGLGVLVPLSTVVRETAILLAVAGAMVAVVPLALPGVRQVSILVTFQKRFRQHAALTWAAVGLLAGAGFWGGEGLRRALPPLPRPWEQAQLPPAAHPGPVPPARIAHRHLDLAAGAEHGPTVTVQLDAASTTHTLALLSFGSHFQIASIVGRCEAVPRASEAMVAVTLDRSAGAERLQSITVALEPQDWARRDWERAWHPAFHRFEGLGIWQGESVGVQVQDLTFTTVRQLAPFTMRVPAIGDKYENLTWIAGAAEAREVGDGTVELRQRRPALAARVVAGPLVEFAAPPGSVLPVVFLVQPSRRAVAESFFVIFSDPLRRLRRAFGEPAEPILLYEMPDPNPSDPLALASVRLDALNSYVPRLGLLSEGTVVYFWMLFPPIHEAIVRQLVLQKFPEADFPALMHDGLVQFIHRELFAQGMDRNLARSTGRDLVFRPWAFAGEADRLDAKAAAAWSGPMRPELRPRRLPPVPPERLRAFFHELRGVVGDDALLVAFRDLFAEPESPEILTVERYVAALEKASGESLAPLAAELLDAGTLPRLDVIEGQAMLVDNPERRALEYRVRVKIQNTGTGRRLVPWILETEGPVREGKVWMTAGEVVELELISFDRPVRFELDPARWVTSLAPTKPNGHMVLFTTIREL